MRKFIEIPLEAMERLVDGKFVEGSIHRDPMTGTLTFRAYNRQSRRKKDRVIRQLENGWLKESPTRIKFFNSVKKELGFRLVSVAMHRELQDAMSTLEVEELLDKI
ncbi:MAG: hypothetical protein IJJ56_14040 [Prevotella sp.]|nr:hypothetical protein [Prevotella sp.]